MIRKIFSTIKNYKLSNLNFRLLIYVLAVTFIGFSVLEVQQKEKNSNLNKF